MSLREKKGVDVNLGYDEYNLHHDALQTMEHAYRQYVILVILLIIALAVIHVEL